jgi:hypothetical protein
MYLTIHEHAAASKSSLFEATAFAAKRNTGKCLGRRNFRHQRLNRISTRISRMAADSTYYESSFDRVNPAFFDVQDRKSGESNG